MKVESSGHIQGIGSKYLKIVERGEHFNNLAFCSDSVLSENVLMIFLAPLGTLEWCSVPSEYGLNSYGRVIYLSAKLVFCAFELLQIEAKDILTLKV